MVSPRTNGKAKVMARLYARAALWVVVLLFALSFGHDRTTFAASPGAGNAPEKTVPQGNDPPGADNGRKRPSKPKTNLGQTEAEMEKIGKEQMSLMEGGKARKTARQQSTKPGTK